MAMAARSSDYVRDENRDMLEQFPELYSTLRHIARRERRRNPSATMNTTVVINEAWLKLKHASTRWQDEQHYLATAALAMRQLLVDYARRKHAEKRTQVDDCPLFNNNCELYKTSGAILALDQALQNLEQLEPRLTRLVELRFFVGLTMHEAADCLRISPRTANRDWSKARAFIYSTMQA